MRVVTFNTHHGTVGSEGPVDPHRLGEVCAGFDADVLALQEVDVNTARVGGADLAVAVARATGMAYAFGPSVRLGRGWYGNALFARGELGHRTLHQLPVKVPSQRRQEPRSVLVAEVEVSGLTFTVAATHLAVPPDLGELHLAALTELVADAARPLVVLGDLNRETSEVEPHARRAGLTLAPHGPTQPADRPRLAIDHVMVSTELRIVDVEIRHTPMSDHRALIVEVDPSPNR